MLVPADLEQLEAALGQASRAKALAKALGGTPTRTLARRLAGTLAQAPGADAARDRPNRRAQGAYFTPQPLVDFVVARTLAARLADPGLCWRADGTPSLRVLDPCAGDGRFLAAAVHYLAERARERGLAPARSAILERCIVGIERDPAFAALASARLGIDIHCREALLDPPADLAGVDVVIGNPPYLRSIHLARTDPELWARVQGRYAATSYGEWDLYAAFIEQALAWTATAPGGQVGLVVPSRWLTAAFAAPLRAHLAASATVRGIVDFGATQLFAGATTYACVVFLGREPAAPGASLARPAAASVAVARRTSGRWHCGQIPAAALSAAPWRLAVGTRRHLIERLCDQAPALGQVARIAKGAGTNADPVFVLERATERAGVVVGTSKAAGEIAVEAAVCRPCVRGRDVRAWGRVSSAVQCIVPYHRDGTLWTPEELDRAPLAAAYLARFRERLEARESGRFAGPRYYCFGRPQNLVFLAEPSPKLVIPDVAQGGRALFDGGGALVLDSAYAVRLLDQSQDQIPERAHGSARGYSLALLAAVLNSPVVRLWLRETGVPLRGDYLRLKTAYLASLPLPPLTPASREAEILAERVLAHDLALAPAAPAAEHQATLLALSEALRQAYGVEPADWAADADLRP